MSWGAGDLPPISATATKSFQFNILKDIDLYMQRRLLANVTFVPVDKFV